MNIALLFQSIATLSWIAVVAIIVLIAVRASRNRPMRRGGLILLLTLVGAILLTTVSSGLVFINPQERGVVISAISPTGYRDTALQPGLRWIIPFAENVVIYPISKQTYTMSIAPEEGNVVGDDSIEGRTADGQKVLIDASVIFSINPDKVVTVHIAWQDRYSNDLIRAVARGIIRDAVSQFKVEEVYSSKRAELVTQIRDAMREKLTENGLILDDFVLRNISFSGEYSASVEQKQIAEQQAQQAKFVVEQRKQEADQAREVAKGKADAAVTESKGAAEARIINAQAEAEALRLISEALKNNPDLLNYQYITKLSPNIQVMLVPNNTPYILPIPGMEQTSKTEPTTVPTVAPTAVPTPAQP